MRRAVTRLVLGFFCVIAGLALCLWVSRSGYVIGEPLYSGLIIALVSIGLVGLIQIALGVVDLVQFRSACDRITKTFAGFGPAAATATLGLRASQQRDSRASFPLEALQKDGQINEDALSVVIAELSSPFEEIRLWGCQVIERLGPQAGSAVPALILALSDKRFAVRCQAVQALRAIGEASRPALPALIATWAIHSIRDYSFKSLYAGREPREEAEEAIRAVGPLGHHHLVEALVDARGFVRKAAALHLGGGYGYGPYTANPDLFESVVVRSLLQATKDSDRLIRVNACAWLRRTLESLTPTVGRRASRSVYFNTGRHRGLRIPELTVQLRQDLSRYRAMADSIVEALIGAYSDPDPDVRFQAVAGLGYAPRSKSVESIILLACNDRSSDVRSAAVESLIGVGVVESPVPHALRALSDKDERVRESAALALGEFWLLDAKEVVCAIVECLKQSRCRETVVLSALAEIGPGAKDAVPLLARRLASFKCVWDRHHELLVLRTIEWIGTGSERAVPALIDSLSQRSRIRKWLRILVAANPLFYLLFSWRRERLWEEIFDSDRLEDERRIAIVRVLGQIGPGAAAAVPVLIEELKREDRFGWDRRQAVVKALGQIGPAGRSVAPLVTVPLVNILSGLKTYRWRMGERDGDYPELRQAAAEAIGLIGRESDSEALKTAEVSDDSLKVRRAAHEALDRIYSRHESESAAVEFEA